MRSYISFFNNCKINEPSISLSFHDYLNGIQCGKWKDIVEDIRFGKKEKDTAPAVTVSGVFSLRNSDSLISHSGIIAIDIDFKDNNSHLNIANQNIDISILKEDKYLLAIHKSIGGKGYVAYFHIDGNKHLQAFKAIEMRLLQKYDIVCDTNCKDITRLRFVSYDADIHIRNQDPIIFEEYLTNETYNKTSLSDEGIKQLIHHIEKRNIDITTNYKSWIEIGLALCTHFGQEGVQYFHCISKHHPSYTKKETTNKYQSLLKNNKYSYSIGTLIHYCALHGIVTTPFITSHHVKTSQSPEDNISDSISEYDQMIAAFLIKEGVVCNIITDKFEIDSVRIDDKIKNTLFISCKNLNSKLNKKMFDIVFNSEFIPSYNPFLRFLEDLPNQIAYSPLEEVLACFTHKDSRTNHLIKIWLLSIIHSMYGNLSVLLLVLNGPQNIGKTTFFRNLLPKELSNYFTETSFDIDKDNLILLCDKLLVCDDEFSGKTRKEATHIKQLCSKDFIEVRAPYESLAKKRKRYAVLCATTNEDKVISDETGNRRIIPTNTESFDLQTYLKIDKRDLFTELHVLYRNKERSHLNNEDIALLNELTQDNYDMNAEDDAILTYFSLTGDPERLKKFTNSEILAHIKRHSGITYNQNKIGRALKRIGFKQVNVKVDSKSRRLYNLYVLTITLYEEQEY